MEMKFLVFVCIIFLSIPMSISNPEASSSSKQVQENKFQGSLIHGVVHTGAINNPSLDNTDARVENADGDDGSVLSYVKKGGSHGVGGGGMSSSIHHSRRNGASSLPTYYSFVFPCIVIFGLVLFPII